MYQPEDEEIMEAMRQNNGYNIEPVNQLLQLVFSIYFCKNKNAANRIKLSFQHFLGWAIHLNSQQLVGESNPVTILQKSSKINAFTDFSLNTFDYFFEYLSDLQPDNVVDYICFLQIILAVLIVVFFSCFYICVSHLLNN